MFELRLQGWVRFQQVDEEKESRRRQPQRVVGKVTGLKRWALGELGIACYFQGVLTHIDTALKFGALLLHCSLGWWIMAPIGREGGRCFPEKWRTREHQSRGGWELTPAKTRICRNSGLFFQGTVCNGNLREEEARLSGGERFIRWKGQFVFRSWSVQSTSGMARDGAPPHKNNSLILLKAVP